MTTLERLNIKLDIKDSSKDDILNIYIEDAKNEFLNYTARSSIPAAANYIIEDMVLAKFNRKGSEGLAAQSYSGISESYLDDYDSNLITAMNRFRKIKLL